MEFIFIYIVKLITFIVTSFVWVVNLFVSFVLVLVRFVEVYILKNLIVNFLIKTVATKAF